MSPLFVFEPAGGKRETLLELLHSSDAVGYVHGRALEFAGAARRELDCLAPSPAKSVLAELTELVVSRRH